MTTDQDHLTPEERTGLGALPRERAPGRLLEARVVGALRARGVLRRRGPAPTWLAAGLAAALALFAGGFAAGQWTLSRRVADSLRDARVLSAREAAEAVQRTGSAYIAALAVLGQHADSASRPAVREGREAAFAALAAAAAQLSDLDPNDPVARSVEILLAAYEQPAVERTRARAVLWF
jgi:hypothetical protein